ncbi:MAG: hypothetical protein JW981_02885 [Anaerolineae bacterium]|nr:hypothetical protein [Anaerolineae bacterium]
MKYYSEGKNQRAIREALEKEILNWDNVTIRKMFGCPAYQANGRLFAFLVTEGVVLTQLYHPDMEALTEYYHTDPFTVQEQVIQRWIIVSIPSAQALDRLIPFVEKSYILALKALR